MAKRNCYQCNTQAIRIDEFDSYACSKCIIWLEKRCSYTACVYCTVRPETPKDVGWDDPNNT